jgi:hypothetical protein
MATVPGSLAPPTPEDNNVETIGGSLHEEEDIVFGEIHYGGRRQQLDGVEDEVVGCLRDDDRNVDAVNYYDDDDEDVMTIIPLTSSHNSQFSSFQQERILIPSPPAVTTGAAATTIYTIFWLEQDSPEMEALRRRIIQITLFRVQRNAALTIACLCIIPLLLVLLIIVTAHDLAGPASHCEDPDVLDMTTCRRLPRSFLSAVSEIKRIKK